MDDMRYRPPKAAVDDGCLVSAGVTLVMVAIAVATGKSNLGLQGPIAPADVFGTFESCKRRKARAQ